MNLVYGHVAVDERAMACTEVESRITSTALFLCLSLALNTVPYRDFPAHHHGATRDGIKKPSLG